MADPLIKAIADADGPAVVAALQGLSEAERRERAPALLALIDDLNSLRGELQPNGKLGAIELYTTAVAARVERQADTLRLALLGTATFTELKRPEVEWRIEKVDSDHGAAVLLDRRPAWLASWADRYLRLDVFEPGWELVDRLVQAGAIERPPRYLDVLLRSGRAEPRLAWDLLAHHDGTSSLRAADDKGAGWREAIIAACDRERLLDSTLDALNRDLDAYRAAWFTGLWKALKPTREERAARVEALRTALGAAAPPVVTFAVEQLAKTDVKIPPGELVPALAAPAKRTVRAALRLLDRTPDAELALIALSHEDAEIQGEVLDRLEDWGVPDELLAHLDTLAATQRPRAEALLGLTRVPDEPVAVDTSGIPEHIQHALNFGGPLPPAPVPGEPVLGAPIAPMSLEEVADALVTAAADPWGEEASDEHLIDGILRFCDQPFPLPALHLDHGAVAVSVAVAWKTRTPPGPWGTTDANALRMHAAATRAARGEAGPLLALPTHEGGWIDPRALIARMPADPDEHELAQALLRLAPGHPELAAKLPGRPGALVRCALGGALVKDDGPAAAAARAMRDPPPLPPVATVDEFAMLSEMTIDGALAGNYDRPLPEGPVAQQLLAVAPKDYPDFRATYVSPLGWPIRRDVACAAAIARSSDAAAVLTTLLPPTEPLPPLALRLAVLALCSTDDRAQLLATDLLIAAIDDGRIDATALSLQPDVHTLITTRLAKRLATIAAAGPLHRAVIREALEATNLEELPTRRRTPLRKLLEELHAHTKQHEPELLLAARIRRAQRWIG